MTKATLEAGMNHGLRKIIPPSWPEVETAHEY